MRAELTAELPKIMADRVQLQQVFMNLMLNAIKAMKDSGGKLTVTLQRQDSQLLFSVSDTGVGLPTEKVDQIFSASSRPGRRAAGWAWRPAVRLWSLMEGGCGRPPTTDEVQRCYFILPVHETESSF